MNLETETAILIALLPFLAVWTLLDLSRRVQRRRQERMARQIALTDAIHRELGAAAAPEVTRSLTGTWTVSMRLPLHREGMVGVISRLTQDVIRRLDRQDPPRLRLVLIPQAVDPWQQARVVDSTRAPGRLSRAA
jgi:4-amino-4-deoxy-L-arabinose transferase-like glycosyltransferase